MTKTAAIIGGGVIGGGWAARFLLNGWDVTVFDPDPQAPRKIGEVLDNARRTLPGLSDVSMPVEGQLRFCDSIAKAVKAADWVQESVPERLALKHDTFAEVQAHVPHTAVIGSSTSGFKPSELQHGANNPGQIIVCHPFNPVYLLPLVEVVGGDGADTKTIEAATSVLTELGMKPLIVRKEIDAHIADRFLEAVWREGLWLIKDGIASTTEIDDAIRFGFGLRWAQMGLFETYRVAGGEAGMAHFIAQFGPALKWPWTKLMDVPELTDDLVKTIADQSDEQAQGRSIRELETIRDNNLVAILRALKDQDWGAGVLLNQHDARSREATLDDIDLSQPIETLSRTVPVDWTDYNGHMNEAKYLEAFSKATDRFMRMIGCDDAYIQGGQSFFTAETHIRHIDEVHAGARITATTQCIAHKGKKMHLFNSLYHGDGRLLATSEQMLIHVDLNSRAASDPAPNIAAALTMIAEKHAPLPKPDGLGRYIDAPRS